MENDGTTPSEGGNGKRQDRPPRRQRRRNRIPGPFRRPMWQEPVRGALYAAGSGIIGLAFAWFQHWL